METSINAPYVKRLDQYGECINPITKANGYFSRGENRKQRRSILQKDRFVGNSKNYHITVIGKDKFVRIGQTVKSKKDGSMKTICHYLPS